MSKAVARRYEKHLLLISSKLRSLLVSLSPAEKAAAIAVANAMLLRGASAWGNSVTHSPKDIPLKTLSDALDVLFSRYNDITAKMDNLGEFEVGDPYVSACKWELAAVQLVILTISVRLSKTYSSAALSSWKQLWKYRRFAPDAVNLMVRYAETYGVPPLPLPDGKKINKSYLMALSSTLPPMFRKSVKP